MPQETKRINIVTLGCSKNVVDSEVLMKQLELDGWQIHHDSNDESVKNVIINTCGFIADAKEESVDTILRFIEAKKHGIIDHVYVMGCLSQRYKFDLQKEIPDVDGFYGVSDLPLILDELKSKYKSKEIIKRLLTTPRHYAYLKISEGCNWGCSYCAIPLIRGKHLSRSIDSLVDETKELVKQGVKELIIIAQDTTYYGIDLYGERRLGDLINQLSKVSGIEWIRLHYAYPTNFPMDVIRIIKENPKVCKYIDIPFQHISNNMLSIMRRGINKDETLKLIDKFKSEIPSIALRTTLLVGHPGETNDDFNELIDFVKDTEFDRLGVFTYSEEEDTYSAKKYHDNISVELKDERLSIIMKLQQEISNKKNLSKVGKVFRVIIDRIEEDFIYGRTEFDSPEVDQEVIIRKSDKEVNIGDFVNIKISAADDYDLYGDLE